MGNPRRKNGTRRDEIRRRVKSWGEPCALCGGAIDYDRPHDPRDPWCFEVDEIIPVSKGGDPFDISNVQPAHRICNQRKGNLTSVKAEDVRALPRLREW